MVAYEILTTPRINVTRNSTISVGQSGKGLGTGELYDPNKKLTVA